MLNKIIEAYDNLAIVTTINRSEGLIAVRPTKDTYEEIQDILSNLPFEINFINKP
ncbi:hypothetical protein SYNTR_0317 [Candidatus Syntrophocurvum alkaliphilum]|uniref:DUF4911 domain-containing protein n=1 Tax=Candidatus Syntrophocurvum alkaliphilum TaxID=2293317 RepID=A0A6I6DCP9_9FIRM|nr:DUF4911 domain-containing protein [Candidatus Syntrophocurvum alkaliphilum]QGT98910.1 hypothetical protein SYNTR_0317 [Candidatus Syntrophocurvum alkaliphilum]